VYPGWNESDIGHHPNHVAAGRPFPGMLVVENFLSTHEAKDLLRGIDDEPWDSSQSGRRKQNYGPKCNFKKKKLVKGQFSGFPEFSLFVQKKLNAEPSLENYIVIEQCSLEYDPQKGACIDPHIDDCWIWGERVVTVNVLGNSYLTLQPYKGGLNKYNLDLVAEQVETINDEVVIRVPMPERSLIVMYGSARYNWEHSVLREDIKERRVCIAYREFTTLYLEGGEHENEGKEVVDISLKSLNSIIKC